MRWGREESQGCGPTCPSPKLVGDAIADQLWRFYTRTDQCNSLDNQRSRYRGYVDPLSLRVEDLKSLDIGFLPQDGETLVKMRISHTWATIKVLTLKL